MAELGRDPWRSSSSAPVLWAGPPTAGCPGLCPFRLWLFPRMETPLSDPLGNWFLTTLTVIYSFIHLFIYLFISCTWTGFPVLPLVPIAPCPFMGHHQEEPDSISRCSCTLVGSSLILLFSGSRTKAETLCGDFHTLPFQILRIRNVFRP